MVTADPQGDDTKCWWRLSSSLAVPRGLLQMGVGWRWGTAVQAPALERQRLGSGLRPTVPAGGQETKTPLPETRDNTKPPKV